MTTRKTFYFIGLIMLMLLVTACGGGNNNPSSSNGSEVDYDATSAALSATADAIASASEPTSPPPPPADDDSGSRGEGGDTASDSEFLVYTDFDSFDAEDGLWNIFTIYGSENYYVDVNSGYLTAGLGDPNETLYIVYDELWMERDNADVVIEIGFDNIGDIRDNNISIVCRGTADGWYEFSMRSSGLWEIWKYDTDDGYSRLANGGISGYDWKITDHYITAACIGDSLAFAIDGEVPKGAEVSDRSFKEGQIGFSITTFDQGGVEVEFDYFIARYPTD